MKNVFKVKTILGMVGIIALVAVIGFSFAACDNGTTSNNDANGNENNNGNENGGDTHTYSVAATWDATFLTNGGASELIIRLTGEEDPRDDHVYTSLMLKSGEDASEELIKSVYTVTIDGEAYSMDNFNGLLHSSGFTRYGNVDFEATMVIKIKYTPTGDDEKDFYFVDDWTDEVIAKVEAFEVTATPYADW